MNFTKTVRFLSVEENTLRDGNKYYTVQLFDTDGGAVSVNIMGDRMGDFPDLSKCQFGSTVECDFQLSSDDKRYRLRLYALRFVK